MTDWLTGHSKVTQWSKVNFVGLQIGRYTQHASMKVWISYLYHLVIGIVAIWVINHFSLNWNIYICVLVEYFGGSKSTPRAKPNQIAWLVWRRNEYHWICPTPPIIANLCANIYREGRYDYFMEDLPSKLDDKTYLRSEKFVRLLS